jgi:asparagine synthase (glutamine-hydrolysing)
MACVWDVAKRIQTISHPHLTAARERYDRVASAVAIEPRDPFMDVRLIEFCLSLPAAQLQQNGWPKIILRRAMGNLLPEEVLWRRGKEHLGWDFTLSFFNNWAGWSDDLENDIPMLEPFLRADILGDSNQRTGKALDIEDRFKLFFLLHWLRRSSSGPPDAAPRSGNEHAEESV